MSFRVASWIFSAAMLFTSSMASPMPEVSTGEEIPLSVFGSYPEHPLPTIPSEPGGLHVISQRSRILLPRWDLETAPSVELKLSGTPALKSLTRKISETTGTTDYVPNISKVRPKMLLFGRSSNETLVVASVDAATNIMGGIAKMIEDTTGKNLYEVAPIIISDLSSLASTFAMAFSHLTSAKLSGSFSFSSLSYSLKGFVNICEIVAEALIGERGYFSQFELLTPIRNTLWNLKGIIEKFTMSLINLIPGKPPQVAVDAQQTLNTTFGSLIKAYS